MLNIEMKDIKELKKGLKGYNKKLNTVIDKYADSQAKDLAKKAKDKAKWQDDTGTARSSITGTYVKRGYVRIIRLEGFAEKPHRKVKLKTKIKRIIKRRRDWGKDYFQHLEFHNGKKYAILVPTIKQNAPRIAKTLSRRLGKVKIKGE